MEIIYNDYVFSNDKNLIQLENVCKLLDKTYWANNRKLEINKKAIENSICIGVYKNNEIIGFARIVTDYATMYWLCDVIIDENHQKNGLGKKLMEIITQMEELKGMYGLLATRDAHGLYEKYGFYKVGEKYMRKDE